MHSSRIRPLALLKGAIGAHGLLSPARALRAPATTIASFQTLSFLQKNPTQVTSMTELATASRQWPRIDVESDNIPDNEHSPSVPSLQDIKSFLMLTNQIPRPSLKSNEIIAKCPKCSPGRPRRQAYSAHINVNTGEFNCTLCFTKGAWNDYVYLANSKLFRKISPKENHEQMPHNISNKIIEKLVQNLQSHNDIMAQLCGTRKGQLGLKPEVLRAYLVGLAHISPSHTGTLELSKATEPGGSLEKYLVFPRTSLAQTPLEHFQQQQKGHLRENDNIFGAVRVKAIPLKDSGDEIYEPTTEITPGLFGFHMASPDCTQIILAGREMDALAAYQQTGIPAVSLPGGSYQLPLNAIGALDRFEKIYIWLDDNCQGHDAAEKMAKKLGIDRCLIVRPTMHKANRPMNASEALITKASFQELLDDAKPVRHEQIMDFSSLRDAVFYEVMNPDQVKGVQSVCFPGFNQTLKGLRPGELTVLTGPTGVGKTTVLSQLSLDFCQSGVSTLWGSFEVPNVRLVSRMINQFAKKDLTGNAKGFEEWGQKFERLPMYFLKFHGSTQPSTVLETMKHAVYAYDVKHVIIDNLQFMMSMQGRGMDKYDAQDQAIATFRQFATNEQVHVTVVVHARKEQQSQGPLDINSVFGSAKITQEADNVIAIQRYGKTDNRTRYFEVLKNRFDGTLGKVYYRYDPKTISISQIEAPRKSSSRDIEIYKSADSLK